MGAHTESRHELGAVILEALRGTDLDYEDLGDDSFLVQLPGEHRLKTATRLTLTDQSLVVEAFFIRRPDENHAAFYRFLLERNARTYGVHFSVDRLGDVYLTGRLPLAAVTADQLDLLLGCVLTYADENFDRALELGFASSIRREWEWRLARGESLANLQAFTHLAPEPEATVQGPAAAP